MAHTKKEERPIQDNFRDHLSTIDAKGKRLWVFAKKPKGKFTTYRNITGILLLSLLFIGPFIEVNGQEFLLLNFLERKFVIFGTQFWPQDFHLFFIAMIALFVFTIVFTVAYGRVWCGWACPQTVFMEILFRRIEYWIEGDARDQKILDKQKWNFEKIGKKLIKHIVFYAISFIIGNTFLAYIIGTEGLFSIIRGDINDHIGGVVTMIIFSGIFYFIFAFFREQVCTAVCPYGRLQGVLLDRNSIVVAYNYNRGEQRGPIVKGEQREDLNKGDCIDCTQCMQVCPTGIDIRNGTQLECINCTACIDACNRMMKGINKPKGLIRYTSEKIISERIKLKFNARIIAYSVVLVLLIGLMSFLLFNRTDVETTILRAPGMLYQEQPDGRISNLYNIKLLNKTTSGLDVKLKLLSHEGEITIIGEQIILKEQSMGESVFFVYLKKENLSRPDEMIKIGIFEGDRLIEEINSTFLSPAK